jgi:hypothetical protein
VHILLRAHLLSQYNIIAPNYLSQHNFDKSRGISLTRHVMDGSDTSESGHRVDE